MENDFDTLNTDANTYSELVNEIGSGGNIVLKHDYYTYDTGSTIKITTDNSVTNTMHLQQLLKSLSKRQHQN